MSTTSICKIKNIFGVLATLATLLFCCALKLATDELGYVFSTWFLVIGAGYPYREDKAKWFNVITITAVYYTLPTSGAKYGLAYIAFFTAIFVFSYSVLSLLLVNLRSNQNININSVVGIWVLPMVALICSDEILEIWWSVFAEMPGGIVVISMAVLLHFNNNAFVEFTLFLVAALGFVLFDTGSPHGTVCALFAFAIWCFVAARFVKKVSKAPEPLAS